MAGHAVGGAFYKLERLRDETCVIFTNAYHIGKELHLNSATLLKNGTGADVLVTRPGGPAICPMVNGLYNSSSSSKNKNNKSKLTSPLVSKARTDITERILTFLRRGANVLLPGK